MRDIVSQLKSLAEAAADRRPNEAVGPLLHRSGVVVRGEAVVDSDHLPLRSGPVTVRISKAMGTPGQMPDVVGVAVRFPPTTVLVADQAGGWDLVMSGPEQRVVGLPLRHPTRTFNAVALTAHGEFHYRGDVWRVFGELLTPPVDSGMDLEALTESLTRSPGVLALTASRNGAAPTPIGTVEFGGEPVDDDVHFDPTSVPADVRAVRGWFDDLVHAVSRGRNG